MGCFRYWQLTICGGIPQWTDGPFCTPTVIIDSLFEVSGSTAKVAATIQNQGASAVTSRGLCYSTSPCRAYLTMCLLTMA